MPVKAIIRYHADSDARIVLSILSHNNVPILKTKFGPVCHGTTILARDYAELSNLLANMNDNSSFGVTVVSTKIVRKKEKNKQHG